MTSDASSPRPRKRQRTSQELKLVKDHARVNGSVEPPLPYVRRSSISPVRPTPSDRIPIADATTTIVSRRYRNGSGEPIYTVRIEWAGQDGDTEPEEREVELDDIDDYVSPAELERFELAYFNPDEVMPGIVIGAAGLERTQTWKTPSSTGEDEERPRSATSNTKKAPRAFVDTLPAGKRRGRPPKKTAAIMGVGPANGAFDGVSESNGSDREASHDLDNVEDEVDPANVRGAATTATPGSVRGVGGYILIPSRAGSAASSQRKAGPVATAQPHPIKKPSLTPISSASVSQEPEDLLSGFNPRRIKEGRTKEDHTNSQYSTTSASPNIAPRKRGRPPKSAAAHKSIGSLLAYVESDEWVRDSNASKSPCPEEPLREPETNTAAEKVNENGEEPPAQQSEQQTTVLPHPLPQPQPQPASNLPETPTRRPVEIIEISSSSDSSDDEDDVRFGPTEEQRRDPRYAEIIRSAEAIRLAEARHRETRENVEMIRRNIGVNSQGQLSAARPPNAPRPLNASRPSNAACPSNAPRPLDAPRPRTPPRHKTPTPGPANPSPAHRIVAHKMAPLLTEGATKETAICLDDDDEYDEEKEYHFSKVIDLKVVDGKMHYLVQWHEDPCPPEEYSWYAEEDLGPHAYNLVEGLIAEKLRRPSSPATMERDKERLLSYRPTR
ncbi:uncharacterized protein J3D65DRAFT_635372 [Phyllosticta citribraziliensis]|uniref:Chromo domain-containing protein n=1 Tax=Phyllosticta citribraziliensis TaxID=989973 RepID=A0ABR1L9R4_9PEZI